MNLDVLSVSEHPFLYSALGIKCESDYCVDAEDC